MVLIVRFNDWIDVSDFIATFLVFHVFFLRVENVSSDLSFNDIIVFHMEVSETARNFTILIKNGDSGVDP